MRRIILLLLAAGLAAAQDTDPAYDPLQKAYEAVKAGDGEAALGYFAEAARLAPRRASIRKDLGYAYLRAGDLDAAREMFRQALSLDPDDFHTALELAFAHQRAGELSEAKKLFEQIAAGGDPELRETARRALDQLESPGARAAEPDPAFRELQRAYAALKQKDYEQAIGYFHDAVEIAPERAGLRKEIAYAYLKIGETEWAREMFEHAVRLDPHDERAALELAFLSHETGRPARAFELFWRLREAEDPAVRESARKAFERVDAELRSGIKRWSEAVRQDPKNWSAQKELAELYGKTGDWRQAAGHYEAAWFANPPFRENILLKLAEAREKGGDLQGARAAWLMASRSEQTRIAGKGREHLPERYPYASEFRAALELDPAHTRLRRDLAYLLLEVRETEQARIEFEKILHYDPDDLLAAAQLAFLYLERNNEAAAVQLLEKARNSPDKDLSERVEKALEEVRESRARPHRELGAKSLRLGYLKDARRELLKAYEANPEDRTAALKLGVVYNLLKQDREAIKWFQVAAESPDPDVAEQARQSYRNLAPQFRRFTTTLWTYPQFSSRFDTVFNYAQLKTEMRLGDLPLRPYASLRFIGDVRNRTGGVNPQFLSESSLIAGVGLRTLPYHGLTLWAEAGEALNYLDERPEGVPRAAPDYRGGVNFFRGWGATLAEHERGPFAEVNLDGVYISRFDDNVIAYTQFRPGYRIPDRGWLRMKVFLNLNVTADANRAYWANFVEVGPGVRFRIPGVSPAMNLSFHALRGVHLVNDGNPRRPNYYDFRVALWYSFAR